DGNRAKGGMEKASRKAWISKGGRDEETKREGMKEEVRMSRRGKVRMSRRGKMRMNGRGEARMNGRGESGGSKGWNSSGFSCCFPCKTG
ncbi:MAG TPA: hypothetical protein VLN47_05990, partial [Clostridiaceae bacterium]|nr:hypothetical protein [Clostridiaceae bacterium]